ncbi:MAG: hypothetical protein ACLGJB_09940 [Blastocatellia bacterium]
MPRSIHTRLHVVLSWCCLLTLTYSGVPRIASAQSGRDDAALRELVEKFFDLYQRRELAGLMALWSERSPELVGSKEEFRQAFAANKIRLKSLTIRKIDVTEGKATARAVAEIDAEDVKTGKAAGGFGIINRTFRLVNEGDGWKVWRYAPSERELAAALLSAKTDEEREAILQAEKELITAELVQALASRGRLLVIQSAGSAALDSCALALSLAERLHDLIGTADALRGSW